MTGEDPLHWQGDMWQGVREACVGANLALAHTLGSNSLPLSLRVRD